MMHQLRVGVLMGGRSGEYEVSLVSGRSVIRALDKNKYNIVPIKISKTGKWPESFKMSDLEKKKVDVVIPVLHGTYGEDGTVQGLLELSDIAYVGAGVLGSAVAMDKVMAKKLFQEAGLPNVKYHYFFKKNWLKNSSKIIKELESRLNYPLFVKPANSGSSVGITKARNKEQLVKSINLAAKYDRKIIVEQAVKNAREIECSVLGNDEPQASLPGEVIPADEFYSYNDKYVNGQTQFEVPAKLPEELIKRIQKIAIKAFKVLDLAGMARVDFLLGAGSKLYLSEANTIPGFTKISMYPKLWEASGLSYSQLLDKLINLALERHQEKNKLRTSYKPSTNWYKSDK